MTANKQEEPTPLERAKEWLGGAGSEPPKLYSEFCDKLIPAFHFGYTASQVLQGFASADLKAEKFGHFLKENNYYEEQVIKMIESVAKREDQPSVEAAIVLLGMQNSRNLILALQMLRSVLRRHPEWTPEGKLVTQPKDVLKYAIATEEHLTEKKIPNPEIGFAAGYYFDVVSNLISAYGSAEEKKVREYLGKIYSHGLLTGKIAVELAKKMPEFPLKKFAFAAGMLHDIGKICQALLDPTIWPYLDLLGKKPLPRAIRFESEKKKLGVHHALISAMIVRPFDFFRPLAPAILYHHEPYLLKARDPKNTFQMASLIALASNMATQFKQTDKTDDPIMAQWKSPELADFKYEASWIVAASGNVQP